MVLSRKTQYEKYFKVEELKVRSRAGNEVTREVMVRKDAVAALVYNTETDKYILVNQWRPGSDSEILEIVAGTLDVKGENAEDAMIREIDEEIGYATDTIKHIASCFMSPGGSTETIHIFYCEVSKQLHAGGGLENEDIDVIEMTRTELLSTTFNDAKTLIAVNYLLKNNC